jgi:hypothetical protein
MGSTNVHEKALLKDFVASFEKFDDMLAMDPSDAVEWQLAVGEPDQHGWKRWLPTKFGTNPSFLAPIYAQLPARFPPLYEQLVLSYRWAEVDLGRYRLRANAPGPDLTGLWKEMSCDDFLFKTLIRAGYIPFGKGPDMDYDPVCFDLSARKKKSEFPVVKIDHEEILCHGRIKIVLEMAKTFEDLVLQTIERASRAEKDPEASG